MMEKPRLLIVDDEWNMRNLIKIYLRQEHIELVEAQNGREALDTHRRSDIRSHYFRYYDARY